MTGTFGSLNIAKTGLQYQQIVIDTTNNNIANVDTDGYVRRRAVGAELDAASEAGAMWSVYTGHGDGVATQSVQRTTDFLMDSRVRKEQGTLSYLQVQQTSLERVETAVGEPSDTGVANALSAFNDAWQDVVTSPDGSAARQTVIAAGQTLAGAINTQAQAIDDERAEQRAGAVDDVSKVNVDAGQMAQLNHNIFIAQSNGTDTSALEDQRDQVALDLAKQVGATVSVDPTGRFNVSVNGIALVTGDKAGTLSLSGINADATPSNGDTANPSPVSFSITDPVSGASQVIAGALGGEVGGITTLLNVTLSTYRAGLNTLAQQLAEMVNTQQAQGYDQNGNPGGAFFALGDAADPAGTIAVDPTLAANPALVAASAVAPSASGTANNNADNADAISQVLRGVEGAGSMAPVNLGDQYQRLITGLGSMVAGVNSQTTNQQTLATQVDDEREQQTGVSLDEETVNLMQAQRAYEASSRVLSVMDSVLDTLINRTGV